MNINAANTVIDHLIYLVSMIEFDFIDEAIEQTEDERAHEMALFSALIVATVKHEYPEADAAQVALLAKLTVMLTADISELLLGETVDLGCLEFSSELLDEIDEYDGERTGRQIIQTLLDSGIAKGSVEQLSIESFIRNRISQIKYGNYPISIPNSAIIEDAILDDTVVHGTIH